MMAGWGKWLQENLHMIIIMSMFEVRNTTVFNDDLHLKIKPIRGFWKPIIHLLVRCCVPQRIGPSQTFLYCGTQ